MVDKSNESAGASPEALTPRAAFLAGFQSAIGSTGEMLDRWESAPGPVRLIAAHAAAWVRGGPLPDVARAFAAAVQNNDPSPPPVAEVVEQELVLATLLALRQARVVPMLPDTYEDAVDQAKALSRRCRNSAQRVNA